MILELQNYSLADCKNNLILDSVNLSIKQGEFVALVGDSGSGKSLSLMGLMGFAPDNLRVKNGCVLLDGKVMDIKEMRSNGIAGIFQNPKVFFNPLFRIKNFFSESFQALGKKYDEQRLKNAFLDSGLLQNFENPNEFQSILNAYPFELSNGQLQRVMIAAALLSEPKFILADEPTSDLDFLVQLKFLRTLFKLKEEKNIGILFVTHDEQIMKNADKILHIQNGKICDFAPNFEKKSCVNFQKLDSQKNGAKILELENVNFWFLQGGIFKKNKTQILKNINLSIYQNSRLALLGKSGSGKSTLAKIIAKFSESNSILSGKINFYAPDFAKSVQILFQDSFNSLNPDLSIFENLSEVKFLDKNISLDSEIPTLFDNFKLDKKLLDFVPSMLSGGQLQRVCIARAMLLKPKLLILDESLSNLDFLAQMQAVQILKNLQCAILFITHDFRLAASLCDEMLFLENGNLLDSESSQFFKEFLENKDLL